MKFYILLLIILLNFSFVLCKKGLSPEEQIRTQIEEIKEYVNRRQIGKIMEYISADYKDSYGNKKESIKGILIQNLMFRRNVKVVIKDVDIKVMGENAVAIVGLFVREGEGIIPSNADVIKIELMLVRVDKKWMVTSAFWRS
ncbi:MAG: hypothetical protein N2746_06425 [Deltaproteobacteria bacterium]|nr:hypothetical protein [Deltaproteobacteria bacterium]